MVVASNVDEKTLKRQGVCAASLPTTMGIVAGFLVQNALKYLLKFGEVSKYLGYNAQLDFFPTMVVRPNSMCDDSFCIKRQKEYQAREETKPKKDIESKSKVEEPVKHESNEWGICLVDESTPPTVETHVAPGIMYAYEKNDIETVNIKPEDEVPESEQSLEELMKQMKSL